MNHCQQQQEMCTTHRRKKRKESMKKNIWSLKKVISIDIFWTVQNSKSSEQ